MSADDELVPVCISCIHPVERGQHYCRRCGACVGQRVPCLPFEFIPYYAEFFGRIWNRVWFSSGTRFWKRIVYFLLIVVLEPLTLLGLVSLPFSLLWHRRRRYRERHGLCLKCGYDLRGSVGSSLCPECGDAIAARG